MKQHCLGKLEGRPTENINKTNMYRESLIGKNKGHTHSIYIEAIYNSRK